MKKTSKKSRDNRIELDNEVIADLEATDDETEAIRGGNSGSRNSIRSGLR